MSRGNDFLDSIIKDSRPEPNIRGNFDCVECRAPVYEAHYDRGKQLLRYWCPNDHESKIEELQL